MTRDAAYFKRLAMPMPFAGDENAALTPIATADANIVSTDVNYRDGFPANYSSPKSGGGKYITRGEMNAIGNLASQNQFYHLAGGINTFDQAFCDAIGGYPKGAILDYVNNGKFFKVISLVDNNSVDFVLYGVDGISWFYLNSDTPVPDENKGYVDISVGSQSIDINPTNTDCFLVGIFACGHTGKIYVSPECAIPYNGTVYSYNAYNVEDTVYVGGASLFVKDIGDAGSITDVIQKPTFSSAGWAKNGFTQFALPLTSSGKLRVSGEEQPTIAPTITYTQDTGVATMMSVTQGRFYAVYISLGVRSWTNALGSSAYSLTSTAINGNIVFRNLIIPS